MFHNLTSGLDRITYFFPSRQSYCFVMNGIFLSKYNFSDKFKAYLGLYH